MLQIGMDAIAIALMYVWAGIIFLLAALFEKEYRRLKDKLEDIKRAKTEHRRRCFSIEWNEKQSRRKVVAARTIFMWITIASSLILGVLMIQILGMFGSAVFVPFLGIPVFLDNALEMYFYSKAVRKQPLEILQPKDQEYIGVAIEVLVTRPIIYSIVGLMFSIAAPFIPTIFGILAFVIAAWARPAIFLVEKLGLALGFALVVFYAALPTVLIIRYHKVITRQIKRIISWITSKTRRSLRA